MKNKLKQFISYETTPLMVFLVVLLVIGFLTLRSYGESWDEFDYLTYARDSLQAYSGHAPAWDLVYRFSGPSFMMVSVLVGKLFPSVILTDVTHFLSFLSFLVGIFVIYKLTRRWLDVWGSYAAALLFACQPLLLGHAFINPKDTPFMVGFMTSIYFGLKVVDSWKIRSLPPSDLQLKQVLDSEIKRSALSRRFLLILILTGSLIAIFWLGGLISSWQAKVFPFQSSSEKLVELEQYLYQITIIFDRLMIELCLGLTFILLFIKLFLPGTYRFLRESELQPLLRQVGQALTDRNLIATALVVGFTSSIRFLGLASLGLVGLWFAWKHRRSFLVPMVVLAGLSAAVMVLFWPYLWPSPIFRFLLTVSVLMRSPGGGQVLFEGQYYATQSLPFYYLPKLIGLQITEPVLLLFLFGFGALLVYLLKKRSAFSELFLLAFAWLFLPILMAMVGNTNQYDNFRQMHFILPPIFIISGLGASVILSRLRKNFVRVLFLVLLVIPGIIAYVQLFPYEYVYYNSMAGPSTFRRYEADYWATSFREGSRYINQVAPSGSKVVVSGPTRSFSDYARADILVTNYEDGTSSTAPDYAVILSRYNSDLTIYPDSPTIFTVQRKGMIFSVVKQLTVP